MNRNHCSQIYPIIKLFGEGANIEFWDSTWLGSSNKRGVWRTAENIGFAMPLDYYRQILPDGSVKYFGEKRFE